jgi:hypothetical protein
MYQSFQTHVSPTTMLPAISSWTSKTTAVNSLMWLTFCCPASMPTIHGHCKYAVVSCQLVLGCMIAYRTQLS